MFFAIYFIAVMVGAYIISFTSLQNHWAYMIGFVVYGLINIVENVDSYMRQVEINIKNKKVDND